MSESRKLHGIAATTEYVFAVAGATSKYSETDYFRRYDIASDSWTSESSLPTERSYVSATVMGDYLYVTGGQSSDGSVMNEAYRYGPANVTIPDDPSGLRTVVTV